MSRAQSLADGLGLAVQAVGLSNLDRAAKARMADLGLSDPDAYVELVLADAAERRRFCGLAVVQETWFLRDQGAFAHMAAQALHGPRPFRVLCAPCATGEEAYGAAMTLLDAGLAPGSFTVEGVDANAQAVAAAKAARYGPGSFRTPLGPYARFFSPSQAPCAVTEQVRDAVRFQEADLLAAGFPADRAVYHAVFCRNLAIYLNAEGRARLCANILKLLAPQGLLYAGHAEVAVFASLGLAPVHAPKAFALTRTPTPCEQPPARPMRPRPAPPRTPGGRACPASAARPRPLPGPSVAAAPAAHGPMAAEAQAALAEAQAVPAKAQAAASETLAAPAKTLAAAPEARVRALADAGQLRQAADLARQLLAGARPSAELYHLLGATLLAMGQSTQAEEALRKAIYLDPCHLAALTHLELLRAARGDAPGAARLAERAQRAAKALQSGPQEAKP